MWIWVILVVLLLSFIISTLLLRFRQPTCGGNIDPSKRVCDSKGSIVTGESCHHVGSDAFTNDFIVFFQYIQRLRAKPSPDYNQFALQPDWKVYRGLFFFAIPELLRILPTDFGQNNSTPYGIVSFYPSYWSCIEDTSQFCSKLFSSMSSEDNLWQSLCKLYAREEQQHNKVCPFVVRDNNKDIYIQDTSFFNDVGLLGAISLYFNQAVVLFVDLPVETLRLNYWSFDIYLADRLDKDDICYPPHQAYMASIAPPLNMYKAVATSKKIFDPLRAGTNTVVKGHVRFYVILALERGIQQRVEAFLRQNSTRSFDFIYTFEIPTATNTVPIDSTLPNPNHLSSDSTLFQPDTDRLCCFLRLSPDPNHGDPVALKNFIYQIGAGDDSFEVNLIHMDDPYPYEPFGAPIWPLRINPPVSETPLLSQRWKDVQKRLASLPNYSFLQLQVRSSIFNIMAPLYQGLLTTTSYQYKGGFQAIQLAGNAQADNYDANYVISEGVCLRDQDALVAVAVNHALLDNCLYNSINVVDINRAFGYDAVNLTRDNQVDFYVTIIGRDHQMITTIKALWQERLAEYKVGFYVMPISNSDLPLCHQILAIERTYVNTQFQSISDSRVLYSLSDPQDQDWWDSLINVTAPDPSSMIKPMFYKVSPINAQQRLNLIYICVFLLVVATVIVRYVIYAS